MTESIRWPAPVKPLVVVLSGPVALGKARSAAFCMTRRLPRQRLGDDAVAATRRGARRTLFFHGRAKFKQQVDEGFR